MKWDIEYMYSDSNYIVIRIRKLKEYVINKEIECMKEDVWSEITNDRETPCY